MLRKFWRHNISGELFDKSCLQEYVEFLGTVPEASHVSPIIELETQAWTQTLVFKEATAAPSVKVQPLPPPSDYMSLPQLVSSVHGSKQPQSKVMTIGHALAKEYRVRSCGNNPAEAQQLINGTVRLVKMYNPQKDPWVLEFVRGLIKK